MHYLITQRLKNQKSNVSAGYFAVCIESSKTLSLYNLQYFFKYFDKHLFYNSNRPGRCTGDPGITDIRALRYLSDTQFNTN